MKKSIKIVKKGGARQIANELLKIRKTPLSKEVFDIVENYHKKIRQIDKKSAKQDTDLGV